MHLILFFIKCFITRFHFFHLSPLDQALELKRNHLYYLAGRLYLKEKAYKKAIYCFEKCHAYRSLMYCYERLGNTSIALEIADKYCLYKEGTAICKKHNNDKKAAYFYKYYNPYLAAKLYKKCDCYYEAGLCMLENHQYLNAIETFYRCQEPLDKLDGLRQIEEVAIVMYLKKAYHESMRLFTALGDYYSVLECAKRLDDPDLMEETSRLIASFEAEDNNYTLAAHYIAPSNHEIALLYTYLSHTNNDALKLSLFKGAYFNALKICFHNNDLPLAKQVAKLYA